MVNKLPQRFVEIYKRAHKAILAAEKNVMSKTAELLNLDVNLPLPRDYTAEHVSNLPLVREWGKYYAEGQQIAIPELAEVL